MAIKLKSTNVERILVSKHHVLTQDTTALDAARLSLNHGAVAHALHDAARLQDWLAD